MSIRRTIGEVLESAITPEDLVDELYEKVGDPDYDWGQPGAADFNYLMNTFAGWVAAEQKKDTTSAATRAATIRYIKENIPTRPTYAFAGIEPTVFGIQLAMRVRRPRSIDQGDTGLCGAVSAVYTFAKTRPQEFAQFALDLFFKGQALLGNMQIEPSVQVKQGYRLRKNQIPWAVDYVALVSLRQCTFFTDKTHLGALRGADETTLPGQLGAWLREAGYKNVEDRTFFGKNQQKVVKAFAATIGQPVHLPQSTGDRAARADRTQYAEQNLKQAIREHAAGNVIILFSDGQVAAALRDGQSMAMRDRDQPTALGKHHWVAVRKLQLFGTTVKLKAVTWGVVYQGLFNLDAFLSRYNGYIVATP